MSPDADARALVEVLAGEARSRAGELALPSPEELLAYHEGRLDPEREAAIGRLLVASPEAARLLLELVELGEAAPAEAAAPADLAAEAAWRRLAPRLARETAATAGSPRRWIAVAAALGLLSLGLLGRLYELEQGRRQPYANLATVELPAETRAGASLVFELEEGAPARFLLAPVEVCPSYRGELSREGGDRPIVIPDLRLDDFGRLTFLLPAAPAGDYVFRLAGCGRELQQNVFRIVAKKEGGG